MEIWDLVDDERKPLGKTHERGIPTLRGEYHVVVEVFTENIDGKLLLTQRDETKPYPLLWECTRGSITAGETSLIGAVRELQEETGLRANPEDFRVVEETKKDNHFLDTYVWRSRHAIVLTDLSLQPGEVCDAKLVSWQELMEMNDRGLVVPGVLERYQKILVEAQS